MLHIYLSDHAQKDLKRYATAKECLGKLKQALDNFNSINELLKETRIPTLQSGVKRLKSQITAWRCRFKDFRAVFTASKVWSADSVQVLRIAPRSRVYQSLHKYLQLSADPCNLTEDALEQYENSIYYFGSEEQAVSCNYPNTG
ncbi:MAG: type II toxin-antitoxin system RelE family toxin [Prochlorotrichaceae cyanobacterium]|jgi:mRNA-degrading endonuclease RelE of RelBE toxin-antitoxin system